MSIEHPLKLKILKLKIVKMFDLVNFDISIFMFKLYNSILLRFFKIFSYLLIKCILITLHWHVKSPRTNYGMFNIRFKGTKIWNDIPNDLKSLSLSRFKSKIKQGFLDNYG